MLENRLSKRSIDEINATCFIEELLSFLYIDEIIVDLGSVIGEFNLANVKVSFKFECIQAKMPTCYQTKFIMIGDTERRGCQSERSTYHGGQSSVEDAL